METNPGIILQRMGVEISPDETRSAEEILHHINRQRIETNIIMEPHAEIRTKMAEYAIRAYPLASDRVILDVNG